MKKLFLIYSVLLCCFSISSVFGGITGKIAGRIIDEKTGEPLPGANIQIEGTTLGAAIGLDGNYVILNVPPGLHTVRFNYMGYQTVKVSQIRVNVDFTTRLDQKLTQTSIQMAALEIVAERNPLVRPDLTNTQVAITAEDIENLPVDQIRDVIKLQAGVVQDNSGALHIRGGRSNEIAYQVNGISINNPINNLQAVGIATNAVQEVSISSGTFSAEYGNALSGVINYVTKDGGPKYSGSFKLWTGDNFSSKDDVFFNIDEIDVFNNARAEWTFGGPVPFLGKNFTFFTSGTRLSNNGYLYGIRVYNPDEILQIDPFVIDPNGDRRASGDRKIVPMSTSDNWNITAKLSWKPRPNIRLSYDLIFDDGQWKSYSRSYRFNPDGRPTGFSKNANHSIGLTHTLNSKAFYTFKIGVGLTHARSYVFENPFDPGYVASYGGLVSNNLISPSGYLAGGTDLGRSWTKTRSALAKLDFVSQPHPAHEIKFGGEFRNNRLERESYTLLFDQDNPDQETPVIPYPHLNPDFTAYQFYLRKPVQAAAYLLDKIELAKTFILNIGFRYEYLDPKALFNPDLVGTVDTGVEKNLIQAEIKHRISPRISLSFPITDQGIIRFSYGHFYQNVPFSSVYRNPRFVDLDFIGVPTFGNANLEPERSIQYEMGLQQQFTENFKADLTVFYKDVNNLVQTRRVYAGEVAATKDYNVVTNISYANVKGFSLSFLKRKSRAGLLSASFDYTFQVAEGAYNDPLRFAVDTRSGRDSEQRFVPLSFDRSHTLNATISLNKANNWIISAIGSIWTGTPYTPALPSTVKDVEFEENSARRPLTTNLDLRLQKFFKVGAFRFSVFMQIENVLDLDNERFVYSSTGRSLTALEESTNPNLFNNLRRRIIRDPDNYFPASFIDTYYQREDWLSEPREIRIGTTFSF